VIDNVNGGPTTAVALARSQSLGSRSLASNFSSDCSLTKALPLSLRRKSEFGGAGNHSSVAINATNSPRSSSGDLSPKIAAIRVGGASGHKVSGLAMTRPLPSNNDNRSNSAVHGPGRVDGASVESTSVTTN
jgi:hypothetical protein